LSGTSSRRYLYSNQTKKIMLVQEVEAPPCVQLQHPLLLIFHHPSRWLSSISNGAINLQGHRPLPFPGRTSRFCFPPSYISQSVSTPLRRCPAPLRLFSGSMSFSFAPSWQRKLFRIPATRRHTFINLLLERFMPFLHPQAASRRFFLVNHGI